MINKIYFRIRHYKWLFKRRISKLGMRFVCLLNGVRMPKNAYFLGLMRMRIFPGSTVEIGEGCTFKSATTSNLLGLVKPSFIVTHTESSNIQIGNNVGISGTTIACFKEIKLGNNVMCGANCTITDGDWHQGDLRSGENKSVIIGNNVWLGFNVIVLKGVSIGDNSVIGAGSVVTRDIPANTIAAGNPCKILKEIK